MTMKKSKPLPPELNTGTWSRPLAVEAGGEEDAPEDDSPTGLRAQLERVPRAVRDRRYAVCRQCEHFLAVSRQCRRCACFMPVKTWLRLQVCPEGKWSKEQPGD